MNVTVLGTGIMGSGMTRALLRAGHTVHVWNRTSTSAEALTADGAVASDSVAAAVEGADVVITMVYDADAVEEVARQMGLSFPAGAVWLQMSTVGIDGMRRAQRVAEEFDLKMVDSPVLGTKGPANDGTLVALVAGDSEYIEAARPVLEAISSKIVRAGETIGDASALKLVCNIWIATLASGLAQSLAFATVLQLDPSLFLEAIAGGMNDTAFAHVKGGQMLAADFTTSFALANLLKDISLARAATAETSVNRDLSATLESLFRSADEKGLGQSDISAIYREFQAPGDAKEARAPQR
jgi:3-hydroxyisobutyrate dehydrogenase